MHSEQYFNKVFSEMGVSAKLQTNSDCWYFGRNDFFAYEKVEEAFLERK